MADSPPHGPDERESETLDDWIRQRGGIDGAFAALLSNPALPKATQVFATNMLAGARADAVMDAIHKDIGRFIVAMSAIYLHIKGGLTLPRLKAMVGVRSYLSPERARALLQFLCHLGCLTEAPRPTRREPVRYLPTARFLTAWRDHMRLTLDAARVIEPSVARVLDRLDEPEVFMAFCRNQTEYGMGEMRESHQALAFTRVFMHRFAGQQIFWQLLSVQGAEDALPQGALPVSVEAMAELHGVSSVHVRRLLAAGVREGLLRRCDDNGFVLEAAGRATARFVHAANLFVVIAAADKTAREFA